ncbi:MAG: DUF4199 domain-containing protein [Bacteroidia bacterium]
MKKYGLLAGLAFVAWQFLEFYVGVHETPFAPFSGFLPVPLYILCLFMAIREKRAEMGGYLPFTVGLKTGLGASAIAAIVASIGVYVYNKWINPRWVLIEAEQFKQSLIKHGKTAAEVQTNVESFINAYPFRSSLLALAGMIFMGGIITIVISATMRKKPPTGVV